MASVELLLLLTGETRGTINHTVDVDRLLLLDVTFTSKLFPEDPKLPSKVFAPLNAAEVVTTPTVWDAGVEVLDELPVGVRHQVNLTHTKLSITPDPSILPPLANSPLSSLSSLISL